MFVINKHSWNPPPLSPLIKWGGGGGGGGLPKSLLERVDNSENLRRGGGGCWRNGGVATFLLLYSSIAFTVYAGKK